MIIKKLEVENFGKLNKYNINFDKGIQIVYGGNEYGKSTIMEFIKMMFYGNMGKSLNAFIRENKRPWLGGKMGGAVEFLHNGKMYRAQKEFDDRTPSKDRVELQNISDCTNIPLGKKEEIGEIIFGLEVGDFERSSYISCVGASSFEDTKNVRGTMLNLINTGNENVSKGVSEEHIAKAIKELKWKNGSGGRIVELENCILKLKEKIHQRKNDEIKQLEIKDKIYKLDKLIDERNNLRWSLEMKKNLDKIQKIKKLVVCINERNNIRNNISAEGFSYKYCREVFFKCKEIKKEMNGLISDIKELKKDLADKNINIIKSDVDKVKLYSEKKYKIKNALDELENIILPESEKILDSYLSIEEKSSKIEKFKDDMENIKVYVNEYDNIKNEFNEYLNKNKSIEIDVKSKREEIQKQNENFEFFKSSYRKLSIKKELTFLLIITFSVLLGFITTEYDIWYIMPIIIVFIGGYSIYLIYFLYKGYKKKIFFEEDINKKLYELNLINFKYREKSDDIIKYKNKISQLEIYVDNLQELRDKVSRLGSEIKTENKFLNFSLDNLTIKIKNIFSKISMEILNIHKLDNIYNIKNEIINIINILKEEYKKLNGMINLNLINKNCTSMTEYLDKYDECLKHQGLLNLLKNKEETLDKIRISFFENISIYKKVEKFEDALIQYNLLNQLIDKESEKNNEIKIYLNLLSIESENIQDLNCILCELEENIQNTNNKVNYKDNIFTNTSTMEERLKYLENQQLDKIRDEEKEKIIKFPETVIELEEVLQNKIERLENFTSYLKSLELAKSVIEEAYNELRNKIGSQIDIKSSEIFRKLTGGKYDSLYIQDNFSIYIKAGSFNKNHNIFSSATIDQAYLSLRIALSEVLSKDISIPLLMDDVLMRYDDKRLELALNYLKIYSDSLQEGQIIIFTCHKTVIECGANLEIPYMKLQV